VAVGFSLPCARAIGANEATPIMTAAPSTTQRIDRGERLFGIGSPWRADLGEAFGRAGPYARSGAHG
jgi:hypothetical protein